MSIVGGPTPQHFAYDSANRTVCLGSSAGSCSARVAYDVNGKRVAEYQTGTAAYTVYVGDDFVWEDRQTVAMANVEVRLGDQRVALKRFQASRRGSGAGVFSIALPVEWGVGGGLVVVVVLLLGARRGGHLVLVYRQPIRAATAVGSALSPFGLVHAEVGPCSRASKGQVLLCRHLTKEPPDPSTGLPGRSEPSREQHGSENSWRILLVMTDFQGRYPAMMARSRLQQAVEAGLGRSPAVALLGPRQCGTTTLARLLLAAQPEATRFD